MNIFKAATALSALIALGACTSAPSSSSSPAKASTASADTCGASKHQNLVGGPSSAVSGLNIPAESRHYGRQERVATNVPTRLNFVHSGTAVESVTNPQSKIIRVFCG